MQRRAVVVVSDCDDGKTNFLDEESNHSQVPPSACNVQNRFPKSIASVGSVLKLSLSVQLLRFLEVVGTNGSEDFCVVGFQHGGRDGKESGFAVLCNALEVFEAIGEEGQSRVIRW